MSERTLTTLRTRYLGRAHIRVSRILAQDTRLARFSTSSLSFLHHMFGRWTQIFGWCYTGNAASIDNSHGLFHRLRAPTPCHPTVPGKRTARAGPRPPTPPGTTSSRASAPATGRPAGSTCWTADAVRRAGWAPGDRQQTTAGGRGLHREDLFSCPYRCPPLP